MNNYTILHCHTMLSNGVTNIDSVTTYKQYIERAKECGMTAMAISEHGSIFGWYNKKVAMEKAGIKYIHAQEFYITQTLKEKIRDNYHCLLIAKNYEGFLELNRLSSKAFNRQDNSFYYVPRVSYDDLKNTSDNIIISTACIAGILAKADRDMKNDFFQFILEHKDRCFFELQPHLSTQQIQYNQQLYAIAQEYDIQCVMCTDTHALNEKHVKGRSILQKAKKIYFEGEDEFDLTFKTYDELLDLCKKQDAIPWEGYLQAIENTNVIADMIEPFTIDYSYKYPHLWGDDSLQVFKDKIWQGIQRRGVDKYDNYQDYIDRIKYEIQAYEHNQAIDFMLLMADIIDWCNTQDIKVGYGRGSANGSVIAWLLGITEMDSIKHKLNFERFMNVERVSLSDIDTDFPPSRIEEVKNYIVSHRGLYCSDIVTFNTIAMKGAIRDVGRALDISLDEVSNICSQCVKENNIDIAPEFLRNKYPQLFEYVDLVNGVIVSVGSHPCGLVVSPYTLEDNIGLFTTSTSDYPVSQINMKEIDAMNYVKLDLLKLDTIELINETCKLAGIERLTPDNVDINDIDVWNSLRDDTTQIFQWEGDMGNDYIKKLLSDENIKKFQTIDKNVDRMTLLSIGNSAIRPAGASYREDLANGIIRKSGSQAIDDFLKPTFGYLVFQCQIIEFLHEYCGFTMGEADIVRRHFAKKYGTENDIPIITNGGYMNEKHEHYIKGFIVTMKEKYNMSEQESEKTIGAFLQVIMDASNYLFSLNHSQPYSYEGYVSGWLRYYYPLEFLTVALNINKDKEEKTKNLTDYALKKGISIKNPKFRKSKSDYFCDKQERCIYKGIGSIKFLNETIGTELYQLKDKQYADFVDLLDDISTLSINSKQLDILIHIDFFSEFGHIHQLLSIVDIYNRFRKCTQIKIDKLTDKEIEIVRQYSSKQSAKIFKELNNLAIIRALIAQDETHTIDLHRLKYQLIYLGYADLVLPQVANNIYAVETCEVNSYGTPYVQLYHVCDGTSSTHKVDKKWYEQSQCEQGDIMECAFRDRPKRIKSGTEWIESGEVERVIIAYHKIL